MWHVIRNERDWDELRAEVAASVEEPDRLDWGAGPREYPCLVDVSVARFVSPAAGGSVGRKLLLSYVYRAAAARLVAECAAADSAAPGSPPPPPPAADRPAGGSVTEALQAHQAHLLALISCLIDTGIIGEEAYERLYAALLARADQWSAEDRDRFAAGRRPPGVTTGMGLPEAPE